jgi:hypothetical protein
MNVCHICGIPVDASFFDESSIQDAPKLGQELILARYELHRNYCGVLMSFAQFTNKYGDNNANVQTPGHRWQIRCNGQPRDPYLTFDYIINGWGYGGFPVQLRLEEGCVVELVIRNVSVPDNLPDTDPRKLTLVGGRITGRYWYNTIYGGAPNRL